MRFFLISITAFLAAVLWSVTAFAQFAATPAIPVGQTSDTDAARLEKLRFEQGVLEQSFRYELSHLEKSDPSYEQKLDRALRGLIAVDSPIAIECCIPHLTNPHATDFFTHMGAHTNVYVRHLAYRGGSYAIRLLLTHITKTKLSKDDHEEYLFYAAYLIACECQFKESKLRKYREILVEDYAPELVDPTIKIAIPMKANSR